MGFGSLLGSSKSWCKVKYIFLGSYLCSLRSQNRDGLLLLLKLTCWKNLTEIMIKSVDVVNCMKYIHFMVSAPPF